MQEYVNLVGSAKVKDSREPINKNFSTVASDFSGESFPTENLIENMTCYRTDLNKTYRYNNGSWVVDGVVSVNGQSPTPSTGNIVLDDYVVSVTADGKTLSIKKKDGTESTINISYNLATQVVEGLMSATDKKKLDEVESTYLPLSGGALTGQTICRNVHNDALVVAGGNQYTADKGALAIFKGADNDGYFYLRANNGITNKYFIGTPQGSLTWDDRELITSGNDQVITGIKNFTNLMCYRVDNNTQGGRVLLMDSKTESPIGIDEFKSNGQVYTRFVDFGAYDGQVRVPFVFNMATGDISTQNGYTHNVAAKSLGSNGYIRYADGLTMQWGRVQVSTRQNSWVGFTTPFSSTNYTFCGTIERDTSSNPGNTDDCTVTTQGLATTGCTIYCYDANGDGYTTYYRWFAIGIS